MALVPNLRVNYLSWVMGPCNLGNGLFFLLVSQAQPNITHDRENGTVKRGQTIALINDKRRIKVNDDGSSFVAF